MNGTLTIKTTSCTPTHNDEFTKHLKLSLTFKIGAAIKNSKPFLPGPSIDDTIHFDLKDVTGDDEVLIEIYMEPMKKHGGETAAVHWKVPLSKFLLATRTGHHLCKVDSYKLDLESKWTVKNITENLSGRGEAHSADHVDEATEGFATKHPLPQARPQLRSMLGAILTQLQRNNDQLQIMNNRLDSIDGRLQASDDCPDHPETQQMTSTMEAIADQLEDTGDQLHETNDQLAGMNKWLAKLESRLEAIEDHLG